MAQVQGGDSEARWNGAHDRKADRTSGGACFSLPAGRQAGKSSVWATLFSRPGGRAGAITNFSPKSYESFQLLPDLKTR